MSQSSSSIKTVSVYLRLAVASHRRRLTGIFRYMGASEKWNLDVVGTEAEFAALLKPHARFRPDGLIAADPQSPETERLLMASDLPFVGIGLDSDTLQKRHAPTCLVKADNDDIGRAAARYLMGIGLFRSYAFVADRQNRPWSRVRHEAFAATLAARGLACQTFQAEARQDPRQQRLAAFLDGLAKPAAVFVSWDGRALDVLNAARTRGIAIPSEISVLGVDNDELLCENCTPPLSSVRPNTEGMGYAAAQALDRLMSKRHGTHVRAIHCPILGIAERESTHTPSPAAHIIARALHFIAQKAADDLVPDDVARHLHISRRLLDLRFRQYAKTTVQKAIIETRLATTQQLLATTTRPVKTILLAAGFKNVYHAQRLFKRQTGLTPGEWRMKNLKSRDVSE